MSCNELDGNANAHKERLIPYTGQSLPRVGRLTLLVMNATLRTKSYIAYKTSYNEKTIIATDYEKRCIQPAMR